MPPSRPARLRLPVKPSAEHLRKQAKRRAKADRLDLAAAQHALARDYGCRDWVELMHVVETMLRGADQLAGVKHEFEPLPKAANAGDLELVRAILASGQFTQHDLDKALARSALRFDERGAIARLLLEHGADPDGQYGSDYGPIVFVTGECLDIEGLRFLIDAGADVTFGEVATKYGPQCPLGSWLGTYVRGRNDAKHRGIDLLLEHGAFIPPEVTPPVLAIHRDDTVTLGACLDHEPTLVTQTFKTLPYVSIPDVEPGTGLTLLHYACEFGAEACIALLLERRADVNARTSTGVTPLHLAARGSTATAVVKLLDHGARQWLSDDLQREPRHYAEATTSNPHKAGMLDVLTTIRYDDPAFADAVAAVDAGEVQRLRELLAAHPHVIHMRVASDSAITRGYFTQPTLLHFVANNPNRGEHMPPRIIESTTAILDAGADVDAMTPHPLGGTTLALVASSGPAHSDGLVTPMLELLVSRGADPTHGLAAAILHRFTDTVRTLLRLGARHTPLSAAGLGDLDALRRLLAAPVDADTLLRAGWAAAMNGQAAALDLLLDAGLDPDAKLPRPFDPVMLHEAAWHNHRDVVEHLLTRGADPTIRDTQYQGTPADWAHHAGHAELAAFMRERSASDRG